MSRARQKYLDGHAEPETATARRISGRFGHVLTIPAYGEQHELRDALASVRAGPLGPVLVVLVVNARADSPQWVRDANRATLLGLSADFGPGEALGASATLLTQPCGALLLIDRASPGRELPPRQGVGLTRKIAADLALGLISADAIRSPWIHCTDADVTLPADYFERAANAPADAAALVYPFRHGRDPDGDDALNRAALEYEISLRYYVRGLRSARSRYAFHTIGSTLAVGADRYAQVRGFPRRLAAEDFYLLNKVAKLGAVRELGGTPLQLSARTSSRTPFGTGRALSDALEGDGTGAPRLLYHPDAFRYLDAWQSALDRLAERGAAVALEALLDEATAARPGLSRDLLGEALTSIGALEAARRTTARHRDPAQRGRELGEGFDAARTLKLIHALRDHGLASLPVEEALERAPFVDWSPAAGLERARSALAGHDG